jgi:hypothetical protein
MTTHDGMTENAADGLRDHLEPLLPEFTLTSAPWRNDDGEWIVTVWDETETARLNIFDRGRFVVRRASGARRQIGGAITVPSLVAEVRRALAPVTTG